VYLDERDRADYYRPSQRLFKTYCEEVAQHYHLSDMVENARVFSIEYDDTQSSPGIFILKTSTGIRRSRIVVFAAGAAMQPALPSDSPLIDAGLHGSVSHVFAKSNSSHLKLFPEHVLKKVQAHQWTSVAVVGGGLTSAQITATAASAGISKVYHLMRSSLKVKHFDLSLPWVGKYKNYHLASFWSADDDEERWEMLKEAKGGGSITPEYRKILTGLVKQGRLELREYTQITGAQWDDETRAWKLETQPPIEGLHVDCIIYATGVPLDLRDIPALKCLQESATIKTVGGMPCLTNDLMWNKDMPLFFTGRLAGLRLGPAAGNLEGARQGAERIAWKIAELISNNSEVDGWKVGSKGKEQDQDEAKYTRLGTGFENQFHILDINNIIV
jgi:hypothetical protein